MMNADRMCDDVRFEDGDGDEDATRYTTTGTRDIADGFAYDMKSFPVNGLRNYHDHGSESSDEEEDTFTDGLLMEDGGSAKPLMHPRQRTLRRPATAGSAWHQCAWSSIYLLLFIGSLATFACLIVYFVNNYADEMLESGAQGEKEIVGCSRVEVEDVWVRGIPKLMTESAFRLLDVNNDGTLDILFAFSTGAEGYSVPPVVCDIYFNGKHPCLGGLLALDGNTGEEIWRHYSPHETFSVNCNGDLDGDNLNDCLIAGRVATFEAVSTKRGELLWNFTGPERVSEMNLYTAQYVPDITGDGIPDIINIHGGDPFGEPGSETRLSGKLMLFDGKSGQVLKVLTTPDGRESYYSPVLYKKRGEDMVLFGTGGETHNGSLWVIRLDDLKLGQMDKAQKILTDAHKGYMTPPVFLDLNHDGIEDIVFAAYNSTMHAIDGDTYKQMWAFKYPSSETYVTPAPGYYNDDDVPDFMISWQEGPGFPVYYHSITTIIDGRNGKPLWTPYLVSTIGAQTSPITVSMEGQGNDLFLFWTSDCEGFESKTGEFKFRNGTNVHEKSRSDLCRLRFKAKGYSKMYALGQNMKPPGSELYYSMDRYHEEHDSWVNVTAEAQEFLKTHPENVFDYQVWLDFERKAKDRKSWEKHPKKEEESEEKQPDEYYYDSTKEEDDDNDNDFDIQQLIYDYLNDEEEEKPNSSRPDNDDEKSDSGSWLRNRQTSWHRDNHAGGRHKRNSDGDLKVSKDILHQLLGKKRIKRHVGVHDGEGIQRLISTGTLAPPLLAEDHPDYNSSIDIVFATYWFYPAETVVLLPEDQACVDEKKDNEKQRFDPKSQYYGMDDDGYGHAILKECLDKTDHQMPEGGTYVSQGSYNPYNVHMGQLTAYRLRLKFRCEHLKPGQRCSKVLPFSQQQWHAYMGSQGTSHWIPRS